MLILYCLNVFNLISIISFKKCYMMPFRNVGVKLAPSSFRKDLWKMIRRIDGNILFFFSSVPQLNNILMHCRPAFINLVVYTSVLSLSMLLCVCRINSMNVNMCTHFLCVPFQLFLMCFTLYKVIYLLKPVQFLPTDKNP